jgi:DNA-binding CsgD family transcriptional regulator
MATQEQQQDVSIRGIGLADEGLMALIGAVDGLPPRARVILVLKAFGMTDNEIAAALGYSDTSGVRQVIRRYKLRATIQRAAAIRRAVLTVMFHRVAMQALMSLVRDDIDRIHPRDKMLIAETALRVSEKLGTEGALRVFGPEKLAEELKEGLPEKGVGSDAEEEKEAAQG